MDVSQKRRTSPLNDESWKIGKLLGKGLSGEVRLAARCSDDEQFAMKIIDLPTLMSTFHEFEVSADTLKANFTREIEVMRRLHHRNIVHLETSFWEEERLYMCLELVEGKDLLRSIPPGGLGEERAKDYFFQLCSAVAYCHSNNVIHGDLKPENILVRERDGRLKLIDFGFSHIVTPGERLEVIGGTILYAPPDDHEMSFAFDNWACGVILFAMLTCTLPFPECDLKEKRHLTLNIPSFITDDAVDVLIGLLNPDPSFRAFVCQVLTSSNWLASERIKELPETLSTLALSQATSQLLLKRESSILLNRQPSALPLAENVKDVTIMGRFVQKITGRPRSKSKSGSSINRQAMEKKSDTSKCHSIEKKGDASTSRKNSFDKKSDFQCTRKSPIEIKSDASSNLKSSESDTRSERSSLDRNVLRKPVFARSQSRGKATPPLERKTPPGKKMSPQRVSPMDQQIPQNSPSPVFSLVSHDDIGKSPDGSYGTGTSNSMSSDTIASRMTEKSPEVCILSLPNFPEADSLHKGGRVAKISSDTIINAPTEKSVGGKESHKHPWSTKSSSKPESSGRPLDVQSTGSGGGSFSPEAKAPSLMQQLKRIPTPKIFPAYSAKQDSGSKAISKLSRSFHDLDMDLDADLVKEALRKKNTHDMSFDEQILGNMESQTSSQGHTGKKKRQSSSSKFGSKDEDMRFPSGDSQSSARLYDFIIGRLRIFQESERMYVHHLSCLLQFKNVVVNEFLMSAEEANWIIPDSLKDLRAIHQSVHTMIQGVVEEEQQYHITLQDLCRVVETMFTTLISDRTSSAYVTFSKEFGRSIQCLHSMRKKESLDSYFEDGTIVQISATLNLPVTRLGEYSLLLAPIYSFLDEAAKRNVTSSIRSMESLLRRCRSNAIVKFYAL